MEFKNTLDNKRYYTWNYYLKNKYGIKVFKVSLNTGLSCPNKIGVAGFGGCSFCLDGSGTFAGKKEDELIIQFEDVKKRMHEKWKSAKYIAYFQANTNTFGDQEQIMKNFKIFENFHDVVALSIATRPDCLEIPMLEFLNSLNTDVWIELGLQTIHDKTANNFNRGYETKVFDNMIKVLKNYKNIKICVHLIVGLPHESKNMILDTFMHVSRLKVDALKIHSLHIIKKTPMAYKYLNNEFNLLSKDEYIDIVVSGLELIDKNIIIQRLVGDTDIDLHLAPEWSIKKVVLLNDIDKEMKRRNTFQGKFKK